MPVTPPREILRRFPEALLVLSWFGVFRPKSLTPESHRLQQPSGSLKDGGRMTTGEPTVYRRPNLGVPCHETAALDGLGKGLACHVRPIPPLCFAARIRDSPGSAGGRLERSSLHPSPVVPDPENLSGGFRGHMFERRSAPALFRRPGTRTVSRDPIPARHASARGSKEAVFSHQKKACCSNVEAMMGTIKVYKTPKLFPKESVNSRLGRWSREVVTQLMVVERLF